MRISVWLMVAALWPGTSAFSQTTVKGYVYEDVNGNGKKDRREPGVKGVSVTNGVEVTQTDAQGLYELPANDDMIVSVIKPSGYALPVNLYHQPVFYYIHKPKGSQVMPAPYHGVAPTGPLPKWVNFALHRQQEDSEFSVLVLGDPQTGSLKNLGYLDKAVVSELIGTKAVLGISLGDLSAKEIFGDYIKVMSHVGIPWFNVLGNHDQNQDPGITDEMSDESYEASFGPDNYAFNYADVHFIMLDDVMFPDPTGGDGYLGGFRDDILQFVANDLKYVPKDKLIVLGFHIPIYVFEEGPDSFRKGDVQKLLNLLKGYEHTLSLSGHTHSENHHFFTPEEGWPNPGFHHHYNPGAAAGSVYRGPKDRYGTPLSTMRDGTPKGYAYFYFKGNTYQYEYITAGDSTYKMSIHIPKIVPQTKKYRGELVVNFFQGSPRDTVTYRVDDGEWINLPRDVRLDKYLLDYEYEWDHAEVLPWGIRMSTPLPSSHIWATRMPSQLPIGEHTVEVRAADWLGRTYFAKKTFKIVPNHDDVEED